MDAVQRTTEGHLVGPVWIKRRCEDAAVVHAACRNARMRFDQVTLSERARQVEPTSEAGASHR